MTLLKSMFYVSTALLILAGCQSESNNKQKEPSTHVFQSSTIELTNGWARPGSKGGNSAAYVQIFNGTNGPDTLVAIQSNIAGKSEVHESYEKNGLAGMRPAGVLAIQSDSSLTLQPGGFHIMLMDLQRDIAKGDSVVLTLNFSIAGSKQVTLPVKISN